MIRQTVVVEGPRDVAALSRTGTYRTLMTHGFAMSADTQRRIRRAHRTRGIIVLTDPDSAGRTIRRAVVEVVGSCHHAWLRVPEATRGDNIGVENAAPESIRAALDAARLWRRDPRVVHLPAELRTLGLEEADMAWAVAEALRIGHGPFSGLAARLNHLGVSRAELLSAL